MLVSLLIIVLIFATYFVLSYNRFQTLKTRIKASIQEIGNQLKRQAALIPSLVNSAKGYLKHEKGIFTKLADARKAVSEAIGSGKPEEMLAAQDKVQNLLGSLRVVVESNPQIKGSEVVNKLMDELRDTADKIMYARRTLIDLVADYNRMIVSIPTNLVAKLVGFKTEEGFKTDTHGSHLELGKEETKAPGVDLS